IEKPGGQLRVDEAALTQEARDHWGQIERRREPFGGRVVAGNRIPARWCGHYSRTAGCLSNFFTTEDTEDTEVNSLCRTRTLPKTSSMSNHLLLTKRDYHGGQRGHGA